jgi:septal ring factor EnvC (AmiA/AmiB activator)
VSEPLFTLNDCTNFYGKIWAITVNDANRKAQPLQDELEKLRKLHKSPWCDNEADSKLQAEIERLRANAKRFEKQALACGDENERLRAKLEDYQERTHTCSQKCKNAACVNRKLRVRVAELEEAVGPGIPIIHGAEELRAHDERITKPLRETLQSILDDCDKVYGPNLALFREYVITKARTALKGFEDSKVSPSDPQSAEKGEG